MVDDLSGNSRINDLGDSQGAAGDPDALGDAGKRALQAERARAEQAEKGLREAQAALHEVKQSHEAAVKELTAQIETLSTANTAVASEKARLEVLYSKKVDPDVAEFVTGATVEELEASAEKVVSRFQSMSSSPATPKPDLTQGAAGKSAPASTAEQFASYVEATFK